MGLTCLVSGSGNVAQHTAEKRVELGAKVVTLSDSSGYVYDAGEQYGTPGNYVNGANIAGFVKVVDAMVDQGIV
jgi:glutamate dehydrogenase/leucine dehydrogenase